ncbi:MAG: hypothetical protein LBP22_17655 [Deltaproteobacteria bacterium]|jgi:hypothetical protein|nr:hypothetical protein [Deltaproteobacteria bacterium]
MNESIFIDSSDVEQNILPTAETAEMMFGARRFPVIIMVGALPLGEQGRWLGFSDFTSVSSAKRMPASSYTALLVFP